MSERERPILFSAPMVRALLAGTKTQTRRIVKPQPPEGCHYAMNGAGTAACCLATENYAAKRFDRAFVPPTARSKDHLLPCPYGAPGDRLYVREAFHEAGGTVLYRADMTDEQIAEEKRIRRLGPSLAAHYGGWKPGIHMPRVLSRLTLEVTDVRAARVQDITGEDARAEGVDYPVTTSDCPPGKCAPLYRVPEGMERAHQWGIVSYPGEPPARKPTHDDLSRLQFSLLWDDINGKRGFGWDANPWVWAVSFRVIGAEKRPNEPATAGVAP